MEISLLQQMKELFTTIGVVTIFMISSIIIAKIIYKFTKKD